MSRDPQSLTGAVAADGAIRSYRPADLEAVLELFRRSVREVASRDYSAEEVAAWAADDPDRAAWSERLASGEVLVWECSGELGGLARLDDVGGVDLLYVHPAVQGRGVAQALLARLVAAARARGQRALRTEASRTARGFFERAGFRVVAEQTVWRRGVALSNFRMECVLEA